MALGIQNIIEVVDFGMALGQAVVKAGKDGKWDASDIPEFLPALMALPTALADIGEVIPEIKDLDVNEAQQLRAHIIEKLPELEPKWVAVAQESLNIALSAYRLYQAFSKSDIPY